VFKSACSPPPFQKFLAKLKEVVQDAWEKGASSLRDFALHLGYCLAARLLGKLPLTPSHPHTRIDAHTRLPSGAALADEKRRAGGAELKRQQSTASEGDMPQPDEGVVAFETPAMGDAGDLWCVLVLRPEPGE
jgi:hypothetical protein